MRLPISTRAGDDDVWEDLVISVLSVNNYTLENIYLALDGLKSEGLFDPDNLGNWSLEEIARRLHKAGYRRGPFMTNIFAERLAALGRLAADQGADECREVLGGTDTSRIRHMLSQVKGVGPRVLSNFFVLRGSSDSQQ
jgi:hypothetical protein